MAPRSFMLKFLILVIFVLFLTLILANIFNFDQSFYYEKHWRELLTQQSSRNSGYAENVAVQNGTDGVLSAYEDPINEYKNQDFAEPSDDELYRELELNLPNIPFDYMQRHKNRTMQKGKNCAIFPKLQTLKYYNNYWQTYSVSNVSMQLYSAYYDDREDVQPGPVIRILAMVNQYKGSFPPSYCHIWYENEEQPEIVAITEYKSIWKFGGSKLYFPYLMTCKIPEDKFKSRNKQRIPQAVGVVEKRCFVSTNVLKVIYDKPTSVADRNEFAICVKGLDFPYADISARLVEWLELHRLLGVHKVFIYDIALHENVRKVLEFYKAQGFVDLKPITLVGGVMALPHVQHWLLRQSKMNKRLNELIPYNDCFYRNMYTYDYIALVDVDEVIMPLGNLSTWHDIVEASRLYEVTENCSQAFTGLCFRNTYYPFDKTNFTLLPSNADIELHDSHAPDYMFMIHHEYRTSNYSQKGHATKCLHRTAKTLTLHNHYAVQWMNSCRPFDVPQTVAHLQHYHDISPDDKFNAVIADRTVKRYREELIERTTWVLQHVGLIK